jgi:hypothetical protein
VTNRAGFVDLHPAAFAGQKVRVSHVDGREAEVRLPEHISPSQPIFDIRALAYGVAPGLWADASYKAYEGLLALPWGYTLTRGSQHEQSVRLTFAGTADYGGLELSREVAIVVAGDLVTAMPALAGEHVRTPDTPYRRRRRSRPAAAFKHAVRTSEALDARRRPLNGFGACARRPRGGAHQLNCDQFHAPPDYRRQSQGGWDGDAKSQGFYR